MPVLYSWCGQTDNPPAATGGNIRLSSQWGALHYYLYHRWCGWICRNFELENFCHLLGIESTVKNSVPFRELHNYRGKDGWNNVYNQVIDIRHLKRINRSKFNNIKAKYVYFYLLPNLIESPLCVNYDIRNVNKSTNIDCEILFYSKVDNDNAIIHLGIQEDNSGKYFPKTFFIEKVSNTGDDVFVANQQKITVTIENRIIML